MDSFERIYAFRPGSYWVGDISYALYDKIHDDFWGEENGFMPGVYEYEGHMFAVRETKRGDGDYASNIGFRFSVDAGVIGVVDKNLVDFSKESAEFGKCIVSKGELVFSYDGDSGIFYLRDSRGQFDEIQIFTGTEETSE